ncbi:MAG: hypothetical protein M1832_005118 [Thelocarpon impressellum]|nr:MAG: hypothetical protein M1832_005118 [Thelocarpon impressellum]
MPSGSTSPSPVEPASTEKPPHPRGAPPVLSRDEQAELELRDFLAQIQAEGPRHSPAGSGEDAAPPMSSIAPESLYPTRMSCREAFDSAFYCQSMGGQFNNLYRYGGMKDCGGHWGAFWFCMRTKSYPDDEKARRIQAFYRGRAGRYKVGPSSEDVWEVRREPVEGAFMLDPDAVGGSA